MLWLLSRIATSLGLLIFALLMAEIVLCKYSDNHHNSRDNDEHYNDKSYDNNGGDNYNSWENDDSRSVDDDNGNDH